MQSYALGLGWQQGNQKVTEGRSHRSLCVRDEGGWEGSGASLWHPRGRRENWFGETGDKGQFGTIGFERYTSHPLETRL